MRLICACLVALLLATAGGAALAASEMDFSGMTLEELYEAREALEARIEALEHPEGVRVYDEGDYLVGRDIPEGDYAVVERENAVFASVVVRAGDSTESKPIMHMLITRQADIHLTRDTWVTISEARAWPLGTEPAAADESGALGEGAYLVGVQLPAGDYIAAPADRAPLSSYSVYSGLPGTDAQLTKFEVLREGVALSLAEGDYIELSGCGLSPANP